MVSEAAEAEKNKANQAFKGISRLENPWQGLMDMSFVKACVIS